MTNDLARDTAANPDAGQGTGGKNRMALLALGLVLLAVLAYANAVSNPFVYDDTILVLKNAQIRSLSNIPAIMGFSEGGFQFATRWTRTVSYALEYAVAGPWAPMYHMTNIALHAIVGLLVFLLVTRMSGNRFFGWWAAALFIVHPINTEVVAHVAGRRGLLAALFSVGAMVLLQQYTRVGKFWRLGLAAVAIYLGVFSKELAVMAPIAFVAVDLYTRFHSAERRRAEGQSGRMPWMAELREHLAERKTLYAGLAVITVVLAGSVLFLSDGSGIGGSPGFYDTSGNQLSLFNRASIVGMGLRLLVAPVGQTVDYSYDALGFTTQPEVGLLEVALLVAACALAIWGLLRRNWAGFAGLWYLLFYLPHLGIIPWHEYFAERFLYLSSIGFCVGIAAAGAAIARSSARWSRPMVGVGVVVLALLTTGTVLQNETWANSQALWENATTRYPNCARAHKALADTYIQEARPDLALEHFQEAARILPAYSDAHVGVAVAHTARREYSAALAMLEEILVKWPTHATALNAKAYIHQTLGDFAAALATYEQAVKANPKFADGYNNIARLYVEKGDLETAVAMYEKALEHNPALIPALLNLAIVYREGFEDEERAAYYEDKANRLRALR